MDLKEQYDKLLRYCYAKTKDRFAAEDIVQETFLRFWQSRSYKETGKELAYLYTIARNLCIDEFRKPQHVNIEICADAISEYSEIDDHLMQTELNSALDHLPEDQREIIILRFANELAVSDIAEIMKISRFSVRRRIKSGLAALKDMMEGDDEL